MNKDISAMQELVEVSELIAQELSEHDSGEFHRFRSAIENARRAIRWIEMDRESVCDPVWMKRLGENSTDPIAGALWVVAAVLAENTTPKGLE